jgi:ribosomal protein L11 methyltransferase
MQDLSEREGRRSAAEAGPILYEANIAADEAAASRIARALEEQCDPSPVAIGVFELGKGRFEVFAHFAEEPPREILCALIEHAATGVQLGPLLVERVPDEDWVTLSQGKRRPVKAGRFLVHGSHDRARVPRRLHTIEIDAGQAFGTAHHASTRGCLIALDDVLSVAAHDQFSTLAPAPAFSPSQPPRRSIARSSPMTTIPLPSRSPAITRVRTA